MSSSVGECVIPGPAVQSLVRCSWCGEPLELCRMIFTCKDCGVHVCFEHLVMDRCPNCWYLLEEQLR